MIYRQKLIEVALPLEAINAESAREKSIRHGHPSTLHLWWARRPLAACRAVLWASLVDDPSSWPEKFPTEEDQQRERQRLFDILGRIVVETDRAGNQKQVVRGLVSWDEVNDPKSRVLEVAQREIARCLAWDRGEEPPTKPDAVREYIAQYAPPAYDPFAGGGSIPLEAQRLGLEAHASDLNPVAVLINKAMIEIPPKFKDQPPVNPEDRRHTGLTSWRGAQGLAADVRYYGKWMRDGAFKQIGYLYPKVKVVRDSQGNYQLYQAEPKASTAEPQVLSSEHQISSSELQQLSSEHQTSSSELQDSTSKHQTSSPEPQTLSSEHQTSSSEPQASPSKLQSSASEPQSLRKVQELTVIAWLWARTVKCPNPACGCQMPLVRSFQLSTKKGKEAWVEPVIDRLQTPPEIQFEVKTGKGEVPDSPKTGRGATFSCLACGQPAGDKHIKAEGMAWRMSAQLMAIVAEGQNGRIYLPPAPEHEETARSAEPTWYPDGQIGDDRRSMFTPLYGLTHFHHLFTPRQLVALTTFSDLVSEAREKAMQDSIAAGLPDDEIPLNDGGTGARAYGEAISSYLAFGVDRLADRCSTICSWDMGYVKVRNTFARQAIPMTWDFAEANSFSDSTGNFSSALEWVIESIENSEVSSPGFARQSDATKLNSFSIKELISTDPPYYDNIGYADLSDFFYVWLRRSLQSIYPDLFSTLLVPKAQELVATPYRFGGSKQKAQAFFEEGLGKAFNRMHEISHADYPMTVYYAFKQAETDQKGKTDESVASTGWETMLEGLIKSDFSISGTWPMRSELSNRMVASGTNALASSIVLVCRPRPTDAPKTTRRQFLTELKRELPKALKTLQQGNIAPVDLAQASIGPGMAVFSQYAAILENDGSSMRIRTALQLINQILDEFLTEQEGEFDSDTRWALTWFEQHQFNSGQYGNAETLSKAKNTSVQGMVDAGILEAKGGKVRLLKRKELKLDWNPDSDGRMPDWEVTQYLIHELDQKGEIGAAEMLAKLGDRGEVARDLAYRLYNLCDRKGWAQEALAYNSLVISWPEISRLASDIKQPKSIQTTLL